jgi:hypothetical protein
MIFEAAESGRTHFAYQPEKLDAVVDYVIEVIYGNYPDLNIPFHSRWGHFKVGGIDRVPELERRLEGVSPEERARVKLDLVISSVLLDAGAGDRWSYKEKDRAFARSEGLAVASFRMFMDGAFSDNSAKPLQVTARGLQELRFERLERGFQVSRENQLLGLEGRFKLLQSLGAAVEANPKIFPGGRPGAIFDYLRSMGREVFAVNLLRAVLDGLGPIWPGRVQLEGVNLGDCWKHPLADLVPFHKLSQWLTYSMIEPIEEAGVKIHSVHEMTGLPEYRNGGLLLDLGLICLRDAADAKKVHAPDSELIVEWRAMTIVLLDRIGEQVRKKLGKSEDEFPLAKVLEGGTWWAGRKAAKEKRPDGSPPLQIQSDGTVF